jgi:ABC-type multidrug transport system ATPase subunit
MLSIKNLSKTYGNGVQALKDVSLEIPKGMFGLLGPNGAGKSTLMRTVATLQRPDTGTITFDGIDVLSKPQALRATLGYLPQFFGVYPGISARELLVHLATLKGVPSKSRRRMVQNLLELVNLQDCASKAVSTFSGGMRQRFGIAQALLGDPKIIIVDEPTAGLDPEERHRFHNLLSEIGENVVVILSTHIVEDVEDLCSQMAIMTEGEIRLLGVPADFMDSYRGRIWRRKIGRHELAEFQTRHKVIATRLLAGAMYIYVLADAQPDNMFDPIEPELEHVYFASLLGWE